ncbi:MAG: hypothetical protein D6725_14915 [Planctomycetota bacterium]|nr:MAG: hypothetical protein D6725_14915 [Planctomycetota bacterium]
MGAVGPERCSGFTRPVVVARGWAPSDKQEQRTDMSRPSIAGPCAVAITFLAVALTGCQQELPDHFASSSQVEKLPAELREQVVRILEEHCGTPRAPRPLGIENPDERHVLRGRDLYQFYCAQCHGVSGDGAGPAAAYMYPRPRDYRKGIFKFTSTPYGAKPRRADLLRTITRGVPGTSMPSFRLLPERDREALVDYVLLLTHRGEFETQLAMEAEFEEEIAADVVPELIDRVLGPWRAAESQEVHPLTPQPPEFTWQDIAAGKKAFLTKGCAKCHGEDGRGLTAENIGKDAWGFATKAADLTSGLLHGGNQPIDIYRRIVSGINGTPMPGFRNALQNEPDTIWHLVAYVLYVSDVRRRGVLPPAAPFRRDTPESGKLDLASTPSGAATPDSP